MTMNIKSRQLSLPHHSHVLMLSRKEKLKIKLILFVMKCSVGYMTWLIILSSLKMITEKHHYSVDVVVAFFITIFIYIKLGSNYNQSLTISSNTSTSNNTLLFINIATFPNYIEWIQNTNNVRNSNWFARLISKRNFNMYQAGLCLTLFLEDFVLNKPQYLNNIKMFQAV